MFAKFLLYFLVVLLCVVGSPVLAKSTFISSSSSSSIVHSLLPKDAIYRVSTNSLLEQGKALYNAGRFAEAVKLLRQAVSTYQKQGDTLSQAVALSNLSLTYQQLGAWNEAQQSIKDSLKLQGFIKSGDSPKATSILAQTLDIQGRLLLSMGKTEDALSIWQQATEIYRKVDDKSGITRSLINQSQALRSLGLYRRAQQTLENVEKTLQPQPDSQQKTIALRALGEAMQQAGSLQQSQLVLEKSLEIAQRLQSPTDIAATLFSLGNNARAKQQKPKAILFYQQAVKVSPTPLLSSQALLNYFALLIEDKQIDQAKNLIPSIQSQLKQLPPSRSSIYAQINFAQNLVKLPNSPSPLPTPHSLLATTIQQSRSIGDKKAEAYALGSLGSLYEKTQQWQEATKLTEQALLLAQSNNAPEISYRWQWQLGRLLKTQGDTQGALASYDAAVQTLESLRSDLVKVNQEVQFSFRDSVEPVYRESVELLLQSQGGKANEKILDKARQRMEALQLAELDNFFREACLQGQKVLLDEIVDRDNPTAAILYPIILPNELQVIVKIPKQPLLNYSIKISQAEVEKTVAKLRQNLLKPYAIQAVETESQQIYNWLIKPIESELGKSKVNTLVFVLDGPLRNLPMSSLYDGKQYLIEKYAIALSVGLQLFSPKPLVRQQLNALTAGLTQPPPDFSQFPPLPGIKSEFNLINQAGVKTTTLLDGQFTSKALENKVNNTPFNVVHLATHGEFSSRAENTFILAADRAINVIEFDNILRSRDETQPEAVELLVLSACQTATGDNRAALGLAGAAVRAGARSTVASLWQIDDASTAMFMGAFYKELKNANITKAEALRRAQLHLLNHPNYNVPSFWSAYVLIGNWL
jgi:CHAT domain-containing protein